MRGKILFLLLVFPLVMVAKKAPKWKDKGFVCTQDGIRAKILNPGKGDGIPGECFVRLSVYFYDFKTKEFNPILCPIEGVLASSAKGLLIELRNEPYYNNGFTAAIRELRRGGKGFFKIPGDSYDPSNNYDVNGSGDSSCCFIHVLEVLTKVKIQPSRTDSASQKDSINFVMHDPNLNNFGDTLFTSAKLVKAPTILSCGHFDVTQVFEFEVSWFNNGVQHKKILVYIHCPDFYGKDYFVEGRSYIITAIPLTDNKKKELNVIDQFPNEQLERYFLLRIK